MKRFLLFLLLISVSAYVAVAQSAKAYNVTLHHNVIDESNGRAMLKVSYKLTCSGVQGHTLVPVLFIDRERGVGHKFANGSVMKQDGPRYYAEYPTTYWQGDGQFIAIYNDQLNPLPGTHTYNARILVWDCNLQCYIGDLNDTEWVSFKNTGNSPSAPSNYGGGYVPYVPQAPQQNPCGVCNQSGRCSICGGSGLSPNHAPGILARCGGCGGSGKCPTCGGRGWY